MSRLEFTAKTKMAAWIRSRGYCENEKCGIELTKGRIHYDHIIPDALGGDNSLSNCFVLCGGPGSCHAKKTGLADIPNINRAKRREQRQVGIKRTAKGRPMAGTKASGLKRTMDGRVIDRRTGKVLRQARGR